MVFSLSYYSLSRFLWAKLNCLRRVGIMNSGTKKLTLSVLSRTISKMSSNCLVL